MGENGMPAALLLLPILLAPVINKYITRKGHPGVIVTVLSYEVPQILNDPHLCRPVPLVRLLLLIVRCLMRSSDDGIHHHIIAECVR